MLFLQPNYRQSSRKYYEMSNKILYQNTYYKQLTAAKVDMERFANFPRVKLNPL